MPEFIVIFHRIEHGTLVKVDRYFSDWDKALDFAYRMADRNSYSVWLEDYDTNEILISIQ